MCEIVGSVERKDSIEGVQFRCISKILSNIIYCFCTEIDGQGVGD